MIRVLIIDDSALVRETLKGILNSAADITVVDTASNPYFARDKIKKHNPDVITLDIEMPRMDGITFLKKLMAYRPIPVIMVSSLTEQGAKITLDALHLGAVDFVTKPGSAMGENLSLLAEEIVAKVRAAATASLRRPGAPAARPPVDKKILIDQVMTRLPSAPSRLIEPVVCIGASTGGTIAVEEILASLPETAPGIVVVQHMPEGYTKAFAERLDLLSRMTVVEAEPDMAVSSGRAIIARGGVHLLLQRKYNGYRVVLKDGPPVNRHKPSVDVLFRSAANSAGVNVLGVLLTGMGDDGAKGLLDLFNIGAYTVAQDEATSVVFGMPHVAIELGATRRVAPLHHIPGIVLGYQKQFTMRHSG